MSEHTPVPWRIEGPDMFGDFNILHDGDALAIGAVVTNMRPAEEVHANAAFIVKSVNSHEALVKALEAIRDWPEPLLATTADAMREVARAALAASKGDDR